MEHRLIFKKNTRLTHNRDNAIQLFSFVFSLRISSERWRLGFLQKVFKGFLVGFLCIGQLLSFIVFLWNWNYAAILTLYSVNES